MRRNEFAIGSAVLAAALAAIGTFKGDDDHQLRYYLIVLAIIAVTTVIVFWVIAPRIGRPGLGALIFAIVGAVSIVVFWLGVPPVFAGAAAMLALEARRRGTDLGLATAALVLAGLTVVANTVIAIVG